MTRQSKVEYLEQDHPVDAETRGKILEISSARIDRIMCPVRRKHGSHGLGGTRPNLALKIRNYFLP